MTADVGSLTMLGQPMAVVPFSFVLDAEFGLAAGNPLGRLGDRALAAAWASTWADVARNLGQPWADKPGSRGRLISGLAPMLPTQFAGGIASPFDVRLFHPEDLEALWLDAVNARTSTAVPVEVWFSGAQAFAEVLRRVEALADMSAGRPSGAAALDLVAGQRTVDRGAEIFCVGLSAQQAARPDWRDHIVFEAGFQSIRWTSGSVSTSGEGWFGFAVKNILIPLAIAAFGKETMDPAREWVRRIEMDRTLITLQGPCRVRGHLSVDLEALTRVFETHAVGNAPADICMRQAALTLVGRNPGPIDGILGPETRAAELVHMRQWGLQGLSPTSVEYARSMTQALLGKKPPASP